MRDVYGQECQCAACEMRREREGRHSGWAEVTLMFFLEARNKALTNLDLSYAKGMLPNASDDVLLNAMHKARYECTAVCDQLRHESRAWLESKGSERFGGLPFPPTGELPK